MGLTQKLGTIPLAISTDASNNVGIGGSPSGSYKLEVTGTAKVSSTLLVSGAATFSSSASIGGYLTGQGTNPGGLGGSRYVLDWLSGSMRIFSYGADASTNGGFVFNSQRSDGTNSFNPMTITSAGNVGIGTSSPTVISGFTSVCVNNATAGGFFEAQQGGTVLTRFGGQSDIAFIDTVANIPFIIKTNSTERMRITGGGKVMVNTTDSGVNALLYASASSSEPYPLGSKATTSSQGLVGFFDSANGLQGSISISGTTVSYNSFLGSHWSQLSDNSKPEILTGTILEAIDELCVWDNATDERLPKVKISDTIESKNIYGVFSNWDNTDDYNDMYVAAVGAGFIRVNSGSIVSMGDLLQSNGDGTAKIQSDDIMRSSTIAKVVSTQKIETYEDGSYLIAATLHCG